MLGTCAALLTAGYALKACPQLLEAHGFRGLCTDDIQELYRTRGIAEGIFPYVHGRLVGFTLVDGAIEYPVLTGLFMWWTGLFAADSAAYLAVNAAALAPFALATAYLLYVLAGRRVWLWAAAPALVLYAFHNWDLLVVASVVAGVWAWSRGRPLWAALWFGIGMALKLFPFVLLIALALHLWWLQDRRKAWGVLGAGVGAYALINLPFVVASPSGWAATYRLQAIRLPNLDSLWGLASLVRGRGVWLAHRGELNLASTALVAATCLAVVLFAARTADRTGTYPFLQVCGALVAALLLWSKVHSPQYTLWLLPFLVVLGVHVLWWAAYSLADLFLYVSIFQLAATDLQSAEPFLVGAVLLRALLLVAIIPVFLRSEPAAVTLRWLRRERQPASRSRLDRAG